MSNRLKGQSSPYLLQHAENPVDWYPWGEEAFEKAERENKPVFLSIGYSTCHWCHVMAHESFENKEIAGILNRYFVSVKVDREERPDVDSVYMSVCQALTGSGGWPMSIFMTADQEPFFAGTYFPPESKNGMMGFKELLLAIVQKWDSGKAELLQSAQSIVRHVKIQERKLCEKINDDLPRRAVQLFDRTFDGQYGGFGTAPKFPTPHNLLFLMLYSHIHGERKAAGQAKKTLEAMRRGGIFDHVGYGFSRYSTDRYYLVPHFEKMLYDNALLILAYCAAYKLLKERQFLDTAEKTADYVLREMTGPDGEFYSAQDADSEGEEGKFYVWSHEEICNILGAQRGEAFCNYFDITSGGNFEGKNIANLLNGNEITDAFEEERQKLYAYRTTRTRLHLDDKILTAWNGLMICALSVLHRVTGKSRYLLAAQRANQFIAEHLTEEDTLYVSCRNHVRSNRGFLDDYACYTAALLSLYEVTSMEAYLKRAGEICQAAMAQFADETNGGYFLYGAKNGNLITRPKETYDGALPSGNSVMAYCLVRLSQLIQKGGSEDAEKQKQAELYERMAKKQLAFLSAMAEDYPAGCSMFLIAQLFHCYEPATITVVLAENDRSPEILARLPLYADIRMLPQPTKEYPLLNGRTTYYVCKNHMCFPPSNEEPI